VNEGKTPIQKITTYTEVMIEENYQSEMPLHHNGYATNMTKYMALISFCFFLFSLVT
jgi:hypothetical protein